MTTGSTLGISARLTYLEIQIDSDLGLGKLMRQLIRKILLVGLLGLASGCSSFSQAKVQRIEVPKENQAKVVVLDEDGKSPTLLNVQAESEMKATSVLKAKEKENPKAQKTLKVVDLPPALQLLSLRSEEEAREKGLNESKPLSIPPPPESGKELTKEIEGPLEKGEAISKSEKVEFFPKLEITGLPTKAELEKESEVKIPAVLVVKATEPLHPINPTELAFKQILENNPKLAGKTLKDAKIPNQDLVENLLAACGLVLKNEVLGAKESTQALALISKAQEKLRKYAALHLENLHFCKEIYGFGSFDPLPSTYGFQQGKANFQGEKVQVYVEVENVYCKKDGEVYESILSSNLEIHDQQGKVVNMAFPPRIDRSWAQRSDYHLTFQFRVPSKLPPGLYTLWVSVEETSFADQPAKSCKKSIDFKVIAPAVPIDDQP